MKERRNEKKCVTDVSECHRSWQFHVWLVSRNRYKFMGWLTGGLIAVCVFMINLSETHVFNVHKIIVVTVRTELSEKEMALRSLTIIESSINSRPVNKSARKCGTSNNIFWVIGIESFSFVMFKINQNGQRHCTTPAA